MCLCMCVCAGGYDQGSGHDDEELMDRLLPIMERHRDTFFVVQLQPPAAAAPMPRDPDPAMGCDMMDGHDQFLG